MTTPLLAITGMLCDEDVFGTWLERRASLGPVHVLRVTQPSLRLAVADVQAVSDQPVDLLGFSLGGVVALACAVADPARVRQLTLVATNPFPPREAQRRVWRDWQQRCAAGEFAEVATDVTDAMVSGTDSPALHRRAIDMAHRVGVDEFVRQLDLQLSRPAGPWNLDAISAPTTVLAGDHDPLCPPSFSDHLARSVRQVQSSVLAGCGHLCFWEQPDEVRRALAAQVDRGEEEVVYSSRIRPIRRGE